VHGHRVVWSGSHQSFSLLDTFATPAQSRICVGFRSEPMSARILVVDDHAAWAQHVSLQLGNDVRYRVIGVAADGADAIETAERLRPDLVVLDIELPGINGIEVARRILTRAPESRILFLSQNHLPEVAEDALATGAHGFVVKSDAGRDLRPAIAALLDGRSFVSARLASPVIEQRRQQAFPRLRHHHVLLGSDETVLLDEYARFSAETLGAGGTAVVVATAPHRAAIEERMRDGGVDIDLTTQQGRYVPLDVEQVLACLVDGWPDEARLLSTVTRLMTAGVAASRGVHPRVSACGEGAFELWKTRGAEAALRFEMLWDEFAARSGMDVCCGYVIPQSGRAGDPAAVERLCAAHSATHRR
jgi:DNA-binding NarL/FixJ family response regulator